MDASSPSLLSFAKSLGLGLSSYTVRSNHVQLLPPLFLRKGLPNLAVVGCPQVCLFLFCIPSSHWQPKGTYHSSFLLATLRTCQTLSSWVILALSPYLLLYHQARALANRMPPVPKSLTTSGIFQVLADSSYLGNSQDWHIGILISYPLYASVSLSGQSGVRVSIGNSHTWTSSSHADGLGTDQLFSRWLVWASKKQCLVELGHPPRVSPFFDEPGWDFGAHLPVSRCCFFPGSRWSLPIPPLSLLPTSSSAALSHAHTLPLVWLLSIAPSCCLPTMEEE